mgnify:FL=1
MKSIVFFTGVLILISACNNTNSKIKERLAGTDSVVINYFKGNGSMDTVVAVKFIRDKKIIDQLSEMIGENSITALSPCGYDGSLHFFKKNMVFQDIDFRMNDVHCMQFTFKQEGKTVATALSPEAKQLLVQLK